MLAWKGLNRHIPVSCVRALALCAALLSSLPARAQDEGELVRLINAYRAAPTSCQGRQVQPLAPLAAHPALARVHFASGTFLQHALERAGFPSEHAETIYVSGSPDAKSVMANIQQRYCRTLLSAEFSAVGAARTGDDWVLVLAEPLQPPTIAAWPEAGKTILEAVNAARATARTCGDRYFAPAPSLAWNAALGEAAVAHSRDMADKRYFSHEAKDGKVVGDRASQSGYRWRRIGENIASGMRSPEEAVSEWLISPGHCANIMNPAFTEMGAGYGVNYERPAGTVYWTQVLGAPRSSIPSGSTRASPRLDAQTQSGRSDR
jgi:uncharacterized protein YkwD